jgi:hypothetical protein
MQPFAAFGAAVMVLGGVTVSVTGPNTVMPKEPDSGHMEVVWPTSQIGMYSSVLMSNGTRWTVTRTRSLANGDFVITMKGPGSSITLNITVPQADLATPIWWVGELPPSPPAEEPPTSEEPPIEPPPPPVTVPEP